MQPTFGSTPPSRLSQAQPDVNAQELPMRTIAAIITASTLILGTATAYAHDHNRKVRAAQTQSARTPQMPFIPTYYQPAPPQAATSQGFFPVDVHNRSSQR
jgi:hypothetical protein